MFVRDSKLKHFAKNLFQKEMCTYMKINEELRAFRLRSNYSQEKLAKLLRVSRSQYANIENDNRNITEEVMTRIYNLMPYLKTGEKLDCIYDYVRIRIPKMDPKDVIEKLLLLKVGMFHHEAKGILMYNTMYQLDNIRVLYDEPVLTNKDVLIEMTGQGCRQFETFLIFQDREWFEFFRECFMLGAKFNRIDLAINDYYRFLNIPKLINKVEAGECITQFRTWRIAGDGGFDGKSQGKTIYFGAAQSNLQIVFYEKDYEQSKKLHVPRDYIQIKNRYELRFAHDYAQSVIEKIMVTRNELQVAKSLLSYYISFRDKKNTDKKYWPINLEWSVFLGYVKSFKLEMQPKDDLYEKSVAHMFYQYGGLLKTMLEVDNTLGTNRLLEQIEQSKMSDKHFSMMKVFLASKQDMIL